MEHFIQAVGPVAGQFGPPALLAIVTIMFFAGKVLAKPTVDKLLAAKEEKYRALEMAKDEKFTAMDNYYKMLLQSSGEAHIEIRRDLRDTADKAQVALHMSVDTNSKLVAQQDELMELARTATPALIARTEAANDRAGG